MKRLLLIPYAVVLMNWAAITALYCFLRRRSPESLWRDGGWPTGRRRGEVAGRGGGARELSVRGGA
ncbi:MAG TPA: hypothetical protein VMS86_02720 [Thermoanaerobaculia bacterium]|nr:hypothetical protein [Thermoanaerobaculia bacterium]